MSKKLSRKEKDYLIAKEIAKERYKKIDELKENGEYEKVEISNLRGYNKGSFQPITVFGSLFFIIIIGTVIASVTKFNDEYSDSEVAQSNIVSVVQAVEDISTLEEFDEVIVPDKKYGKLVEGVGTSEYIAINKGQKSVEIRLPYYIDTSRLMNKGFQLHLYDKDKKHIRSEYSSLSPHFERLYYLGTDIMFVKVEMVDKLKWELQHVLNKEVITMKNERVYELEGSYLIENSNVCDSFIVTTDKETKIDYGIYTKDNKYIDKNNDIIKERIKLYSKFDNELVKFKAETPVKLYCN